MCERGCTYPIAGDWDGNGVRIQRYRPVHTANIERASVIIIEVTAGWPDCYGKSIAVHRSKVDLVIDSGCESSLSTALCT